MPRRFTSLLKRFCDGQLKYNKAFRLKRFDKEVSQPQSDPQSTFDNARHERHQREQ